MCVYSMVMDYYRPQFDRWPTWIPSIPPGPIAPFEQPPIQPMPADEMAKWAALFKKFHEAAEAAKVVDKLTAQPDCEDPEKAKLVARVAELEKRLADIAALTGPTAP